MILDSSVFLPRVPTYKGGYLKKSSSSKKSVLIEFTTCGIGRTRFLFETYGDSVPLTVIFEDGSSLQRQPATNTWFFAKDCIKSPWHGEVFVNDNEAIIIAGAVADIFKIDGSHIRFLNDKIVLLVTMCGDVFEIDYSGAEINDVRLNGLPYLRRINGGWELLGTERPILGVPEISMDGFSFDAIDSHKYFDKYLTSGNLTTMRDGKCKFSFGVARA
ncbi:MAG: hypothetical protein K2Y39_27590 [Candidatus Obscuribacterales bacterium]|nr:hypothetical protein [Candidatus Obscuribacterales bacterium]